MGITPSARSTKRPLAVVSGGGSGIGRATALELAARGYDLALLGRHEEDLRAVLSSVAGQGEAYPCDVRDWQAIKTTAERIHERWGAAEVVLPAAGIATIAPFVESDPDAFAAVVDTNLGGCYHLFRALLPPMIERGSGHLFPLVSVAGTVGFPGWSAYCASKWGLAGMIAALREELVGTGVRLTAIYPGATASDLWSDLPGEWDRGRMIPVAEVVRAVCYALSSGPETVIDEIHLNPAGGPL